MTRELSKIFPKKELVKYTVRRALELRVDDIDLMNIVGSTDYPRIKQAVDSTVLELVDYKSGSLRCGLCSRGPFTKRGLYLHLTRVHSSDILNSIDEKLKSLLRTA